MNIFPQEQNIFFSIYIQISFLFVVEYNYFVYLYQFLLSVDEQPEYFYFSDFINLTANNMNESSAVGYRDLLKFA